MNKKQMISIAALLLLIAGFNFYPLDYYVMKPGGAYDVSDFISVKGGDEDDEGSFSLMTVSIGKATPATYLWAKVRDYQEILKLEAVRQEGEDDEEYRVRQLKLMSDSQFNALYVAFSRAELPFTVSYKGVYVLNVLEDGAADGVLKAGDIVVELNGEQIKRQESLTDLLSDKKLGDEIEIVINRDDELITEKIKLKEIPGSEGRVGIGISFAESKTIKTDPDVKANTEEIGGPSAGLMFTLEILNQLIDEDLTKGYEIAGTGEMLENGQVGRIGGIEKKVVAANKAGIEIFFAPNDVISESVLKDNPTVQPNYEVAVKTAKEIGTTMKIVPVKTVDDAIAYLEALQPK